MTERIQLFDAAVPYRTICTDFYSSLDNNHEYCGEIQTAISNDYDWKLDTNCWDSARPFACERDLSTNV